MSTGILVQDVNICNLTWSFSNVIELVRINALCADQHRLYSVGIAQLDLS